MLCGINYALGAVYESPGNRGEPFPGKGCYYVDPEVLENAIPIPIPDYKFSTNQISEDLDQLITHVLDPVECLPYTFPETNEIEMTTDDVSRSDRSFTRITTTTDYPYRTIGKLYMRWGSEWYVGSASFIFSGYLLFTAGYCLYHDEPLGYWAWAEETVFIPGMNGSSQPYGQFSVNRIGVSSGWFTDHDWEHDWGVAELSDTAGLGWMGYRYSDDFNWYINRYVNMTGYPEEWVGHGWEMWQNFDKIWHATNTKLWYHGTSYGGMSGGPIWQDDIGMYYILGCHRVFWSERYQTQSR